jgi:hypothetical protein
MLADMHVVQGLANLRLLNMKRNGWIGGENNEEEVKDNKTKRMYEEAKTNLK